MRVLWKRVRFPPPPPPQEEVIKPEKEVDSNIEIHYNKSMLDKVLGSDIAMKIMLHLVHYEEIYPSAVANDYELTLSAVQKQFSRFEDAGILVSKLVGKTRVYMFNKKSKAANKFYDFVKIYYDGLSVKDKEKIFSLRRRPRRPGKPVVVKNEN